MSALFTINDIFQIADSIEQAGFDFYREAADHAEGEVKQFLLTLSEMEAQHGSYFESLRETYNVDEIEHLFDSDSDELKYLRLIGEGHVLHHLRDFFVGNTPSVTQIFQKAIEFEKDTVVYFTSLKAALTSPTEMAKVDEIIIEGSRHVGILN